LGACLIRWGFYTVKNKRSLKVQLPANGVLYIRRLFCKIVRRTLSFLPDFLLPYKCYTNRFVEAVFENYLTKGRKLCATAHTFMPHYQTLLKWLRGLASKREIKAVCFSRYGPLADIPDKEYARRLWMILKKAFGAIPGGVLSAAGGLLWAEYECPLF